MDELNLNALLDREEIEKEFINSLTYFEANKMQLIVFSHRILQI